MAEGAVTRVLRIRRREVPEPLYRAMPATLDPVLRRLTAVGVRSLVSQPPTLEELFLRYYDGEATGSSTAPVAAEAGGAP